MTRRRQTQPIILHFDCFYASVFEHHNPALKSVPLAVQQKQILVTCNYEARRRGLHKLQLIHQAKKACPDLVIVLGEDLTPFRDASKQLYAFLRSFSWNGRCERLGFDEVFMDVTDIIDYNVSILNPNDLHNAFFCLAKHDPAIGFPYDATRLTGHLYPKTATDSLGSNALDALHLKLALGSHLAHYLRSKLASEKGYTATVGISTNKLLSKLVGNTYKPNAQTTLVPPYVSNGGDETEDNVTQFLDAHEVGKIPGIGFKTAQKLRAFVLQRPASFDTGLVYGRTKEDVLVRDVRMHPDMGPETLERVLGGPGVPQGIGARIWGLLNGCDETEVGQARQVPTQISIEDSYIRLDTLDAVVKELRTLAKRLLERMHADLLAEDEDDVQEAASVPPVMSKRWLAHPKTIRLSTRPRPPPNLDGSRSRSFARISKSAPMPAFVFNLKDDILSVTERLLHEALLPLFRRLHPEKRGWNLSLVNVAATNMANVASEKGGVGRDISKMFKHQDEVLRQWKIDEASSETDSANDAGEGSELSLKADSSKAPVRVGSEDVPTASQEVKASAPDIWESEDEQMIDGDLFCCDECGAAMPAFAIGAHYRWHAQR